MGKVIDFAKASEIISKSQNKTVKLLKYSGVNEYGEFLCLVCGKKWFNKSSGDVVHGRRHCPNCHNKNRGKSNIIPFDDVVSFIEGNSCEYVAGNYENSKSKLLIKYRCGHEEWTKLSNLKNMKNFLCKKCEKERIADIFKPTNKEIALFLKKLNLKLVDFPNGYKNGKSLVTYVCKNNHSVTVQYNTIKRKKKCSECAIKEQYENRRGKNHPLWNGGSSLISPLIKGSMIEWKKESMKFCGYRCFITGEKFHAIHHLYGFNMILEEAIENLKISHKNYLHEYTENEINSLVSECKRLHTKYPLGVCLRRDVHILFHKIYGSKNNTPEQFYDFVEKIKSGQIQINYQK